MEDKSFQKKEVSSGKSIRISDCSSGKGTKQGKGGP